MKPKDPIELAKQCFRECSGLLRTSEALRSGIHPRTLYRMRDAKIIERLSRGLYRLTELPALGNPDLVSVARKIPNGVICLISALAYHELTTQIPHEIYLALPRGAAPPRLEHPPLRIIWSAGAMFAEGIETYKLDGVPVRCYSPEKTLADCFKYRNKIGLEVAVEALKLYRERRPIKGRELLKFARICRVEKIMQPYLEALL